MVRPQKHPGAMYKLWNICRKILDSSNLSSRVEVSYKIHTSSGFSCQRTTGVPSKIRSFRAIETVEEEKKKKKLDAVAVSLLIIPLTSFGLGCWQVKRRKWKEGLIAELKERRDHEPVPLPKNLDELENMEYYSVRVKGKFLHDREMYIGPRSLLLEEGKRNMSSGMVSSSSKVGYLVVTPFQLSDTGRIILVNRGWIPAAKWKDRSQREAQDNREVELSGIIRLNEKIPRFGLRNEGGSNLWIYRDVKEMAEFANAEPVFIDADASSTVPGGPIGGQTRISLPNEHLSYIKTWFGLSLVTSGLWYLKYMRGIPLW